ncbi:hypothetical protein SISNIDRAFT_489077 [Sistotremastrum niveocremeum HHB9708]|uniref:F-box domain-containing protein n=1 Tax=Sistotremastrum niveocremeum HHB9708 TaxID=1314777 RepID=A0A164QH33_9AGAM|nr:hypothetical protein SISNIDRAFT_489077 [Sistotremastrum niveocremeum HHB9708]
MASPSNADDSPFAALPVEIIHLIVRLAAGMPRNLKTIKALNLCCKTFHSIVTPFLFQSLVVRQTLSAHSLASTLFHEPPYRQLVERLVILDPVESAFFPILLELVHRTLTLHASKLISSTQASNYGNKLPQKLIPLEGCHTMMPSRAYVNCTHFFVKEIRVWGGHVQWLDFLPKLGHLCLTCLDLASLIASVSAVDHLIKCNVPLTSVTIFTPELQNVDIVAIRRPSIKHLPYSILYMSSEDLFNLWRDIEDGIMDPWDTLEQLKGIPTE